MLSVSCPLDRNFAERIYPLAGPGNESDATTREPPPTSRCTTEGMLYKKRRARKPRSDSNEVSSLPGLSRNVVVTRGQDTVSLENEHQGQRLYQ